MGDKILNYSEIYYEQGKQSCLIIQYYETYGLDIKIEELFRAMINRDWIQSMYISESLYKSVGYIKAKPFGQTAKTFEKFIREYCKLNSPYCCPSDQQKYLQHSLKDEFDDEKKLKAYEYFHPIVEQARLLKFEISKYTGTKVPDNIYLVESERIKKMHDDLKQHIAIQRLASEQNNQCFQIKQKMNYIVEDAEDIQMSMNSKIKDNIAVDLQQYHSRNNKCVLF